VNDEGVLDVSCPRCGLKDKVEAVPALVEAGRSTYSGSSTTNGVSAGTGLGFGAAGVVGAFGVGVSSSRSRHAGEIVENLAATLAPTPGVVRVSRDRKQPRQPWQKLAALLLVGLSISAGASAHSATVGYMLFLAVSVGLGALGIYVMRWRIARNRRVRRGEPLAFAVWSAGWFCRRCGGAFILADADVPPVDGLAPGTLYSAERFSALVWEAGGYADLARPDWRETVAL
jgi:hypothetical protein